jgi:hypothetical protein
MSSEVRDKTCNEVMAADEQESEYPPVPPKMMFTLAEVAWLTNRPYDRIADDLFHDRIEAKYGPDIQGRDWYIPRDEVFRLRGEVE